MGKKNLLVMAASIFLATANAPTATAQEAGGVEISTTSILPITGVTAATDGNYNFKSFDGADGVIGGHEYVDLGLPSGTLWATYNVGATSPYERVITLHGEKWSHVKISHGKTTSSLKGMK